MISRPRTGRVSLRLVVAVATIIILVVVHLRHRDEDAFPSFLSESTARDNYCSPLGWKTYSRRRSHRKIYDLVLVNNELDWLEIRLNELESAVDYFVLLESRSTFTGHSKSLVVKENLHNFSRFRHRIIHHILDDSELHSNDTWDRERFQRNAMLDQVFPYLTGAQKPQKGDVILVSDVDEIPKANALAALRNCAFPKKVTLSSRFFYYSFQWRHRGPDWPHPQATFYDGRHTLRPADLRDIGRWDTGVKPEAIVLNAAWHCSSCFATIGEMINKIQSFSHEEFNRAEFLEPSGIVTRVRQGLDLFDRQEEVYDFVPNNPDTPEFLKQNTERFKYMLSRDGDNAGFRDYNITL